MLSERGIAKQRHERNEIGIAKSMCFEGAEARFAALIQKASRKCYVSPKWPGEAIKQAIKESSNQAACIENAAKMTPKIHQNPPQIHPKIDQNGDRERSGRDPGSKLAPGASQRIQK